MLVESINPKQISQLPTSERDQPNPQSRYYSVLTGLARFGVARVLARPLTHLLSPGLLPNEDAYYARFVRTQSMQAARNELNSLSASAAEAAAVKSFGDLPLIVLTGRLHTDPDWQTWQTELLQLSSDSQHLFAENSNHGIQFEEPDAAVTAILQVVQQVRQTAKK